MAIARRTRIQGWHLAAALVLVAAVFPATASASYPGPNGRIFFAAGADVWSVGADGAGLVDLTDLPGGTGSGADPSVSPQGLVAFVVGGGASAEIWTVRADGSDPRRLTANAALDSMPSISADGERIAFASDRGGAGVDIWTMGVDGSSPTPLLTAPGDDEYPQFAPDGAGIVVVTHIGADLDLAWVPASGGPFASATAITHDALDESTPALQPDQVRLGYARAGDILTAYYDGTDEFPLANSPTAESFPAYSPDGAKIVYSTTAGLVVADAGGFNPHPLPTPGAVAPTTPDWALGPETQPPQTSITKRPHKRTARRSARFRFESDEPGSSFECRLDGAAFSACESPLKLKRLRLRRHRFEVRAIDAAGNTDPVPARARFRVIEPR